MDRVAALSYLNGFAGRIYRTAQRATTDTQDGYGPAIDEAIRTILGPSTDLLVYTVPTDSAAAFRAALRYQALALVEWDLLPFADNQVDAPLTNVKLSQVVKNVREMKAQALGELSQLGFGPANVSKVIWVYDYLEPNDRGAEYAS